MNSSEQTNSDVFAKQCMDISETTGYFIDPFGVVPQQMFNLTGKKQRVIIESITHEESPF